MTARNVKHMETLNINGRNHYSNILSNFERVRKGVYTVYRRDVEFTIEGGRALGGSRNDWFITGGAFIKPLVCTSIMDAIRVLENM